MATERDYVLISDLARVRAACSLLNECNGTDDDDCDALRAARLSTHRLAQMLIEKIEIEGGER